MQKIFSKIWSKYDVVMLLPENEQKFALQSILAELEEISEDKQNDEYFYLKGFINYMKEPSDIPQAKEYFQKALEVNPTESYAKLYLGHCLYDLGSYKEAKYQFSTVDEDGFNTNVKDLLQMKVEEMLVCCHVKLTDLDEQSFIEAKIIINKYFKLDYLDDYLFNLSKLLKEFDIKLDELASKDL